MDYEIWPIKHYWNIEDDNSFIFIFHGNGSWLVKYRKNFHEKLLNPIRSGIVSNFAKFTFGCCYNAGHVEKKFILK